MLHRSGEYEAALAWFRTVYDYTARKGDERKIYYGLKQEEDLPEESNDAESWLSDQLNPHSIGRTRGNTYTKFTLLAIIRCLLDYADAEFSQDNVEAQPRARTLYQTALDLLNEDVFKPHTQTCDALLAGLSSKGESIANPALAARLRGRLRDISRLDRLRDAVVSIRKAIRKSASAEEGFLDADYLVARTQAESSYRLLGEAFSSARQLRRQLYRSAASTRNISETILKVSDTAERDFSQAMVRATHLSAEDFEDDSRQFSWLRFPATSGSDGADSASPATLSFFDGLLRFKSDFVPSASALWGCIPPNPVWASLRQHAEVNLIKLRTGRNIAGSKRDLASYAAPTNVTSALPMAGAAGRFALPGTATVQPTLYRYQSLVDRAKQLVQVAQQVEASMLSVIQQEAAEQYNLLKARQDLGLAQAGVNLKTAQLTEANDGVTLAKDQADRVTVQSQYYNGLLADKSLSKLESDAVQHMQNAADRLNDAAGFLSDAGTFQTISGAVSGAMQLAQLAGGEPVGTAVLGTLGGILGGGGPDLASQAAVKSTEAGIESTLAGKLVATESNELRRRDWEFQRDLAAKDEITSKQQITIATDHAEVADQELSIAKLQVANATDAVQFLANQFNNPELYDWMAGVLEGIYRFFLRQATVMAKLAQNQLAFERQDSSLSFINADYWAPPSSSEASTVANAAAPNRRGLTGAERLLQDIYDLDQYAFQTDKRKLQLSKTLSLARTAPAEFQRFKETGSLVFSTPMERFDRDFPGHYLRLISRVRTSVAALIPPTEGIKATLSSSAVSRVVIGGDIFQTVSIQRDPQYVALTSPLNSSGLFELDVQSDMLRPFEGNGVDTTWEFSLPKAANQFDYSSIADVLITIDYTALNSFDYRSQVIRDLNPELSADRSYSFGNSLPDQWYDLHNPDQSSTPMAVRFRTVPEDFPPNITDLRIQQVLLYFSRADGQAFEVTVTSLRFIPQGEVGGVGGGATSIDGIISTRRGNAGSWTAMIGKAPYGQWELTLPKTDDVRAHFNNDDIQDMLFVITYSGRTPDWAS
jgi:hypothetical protein